MPIYNPWEDWTTAATTAPFDYWCDTGTSGTSGTSAVSTWVDWNPGNPVFRSVTPPVEEINQRKIHAIEAEDRRKAAIASARELLVASLTPDQRKEYDENKSFIVFGQKTGVRYRIHDARVGNVHELDGEGRTRRRYCAHPAMYVPTPDTQLAQKLMLECHEQDFLDRANVS